MKHRIAAVAGLALVIAMSQATPCYADVVAFPDPTATGALIWVAIAFVALVSGLSFFLLRRIARRRAAGAPAPEVAAEPEAGDTFEEWTEEPEAPHED